MHRRKLLPYMKSRLAKMVGAIQQQAANTHGSRNQENISLERMVQQASQSSIVAGGRAIKVLAKCQKR